MVSTHESNPKHAIGRERHDNLQALYVTWSMDFPITSPGKLRQALQECQGIS